MTDNIIPLHRSTSYDQLPNIPAIKQLTSKPQWVSWKVIPPKKPGGKPRKVPVNPKNNSNGSTTDPTTWANYSVAVENSRRNNHPGVGYVLSGKDGLYGIDLDKVLNPETGEFVDWVKPIIEFAESYTEISPSGTGLRMFCCGELVEAIKWDAAQVEIYSTERYLTVTGCQVDNTPDHIAAAPRTLEYLKARVKEFGGEVDDDDDDIGIDQSIEPDDNHLTIEGLNTLLLKNLPKWVPDLFKGREEKSRKGYRVPSVNIDRPNEEDISIISKGIVDYGVHDMGDQNKGKRSPLKLIWEWWGYPNPERPTERWCVVWACNKLGVKPPPELATILVKRGELARAAEKCEELLQGSDIFDRGRILVKPVLGEADNAHGGKTRTAMLNPITPTGLRRMLEGVARFTRYDARSKKPLVSDPPKEIPQYILANQNAYPFPTINGVLTCPTLRPDGSLLIKPGFDAATGMYLIEPPPMPEIPERPTKKHAEEALKLVDGLLVDFPFTVTDDGKKISRSVAYSTVITPVVRGAFTKAPIHAISAPVAGSGKSYLADIVSVIVSGHLMPVMTADRKDEETDKRLDAMLLAGRPLICIDNVSPGIILGTARLNQMMSQTMVDVRILGQSEMPRVDTRGVSVLVNGNNLVIRDDLMRRVLLATLDPKHERPELREFKTNPVKMVLANRGKYIAACLTICRAFLISGEPTVAQKLGSFEGWSDVVRSALVWLGCDDPVASTEVVRAEDPDLIKMRTLFKVWASVIGVDFKVSFATLVARTRVVADNRQLKHPELARAVRHLAPPNDGGSLNRDAVGKWLRDHKNRTVNGRTLRSKPGDPAMWWVEQTGVSAAEPASSAEEPGQPADTHEGGDADIPF
ncbi:hypothetical protein JQ543_13690 [Bradyrhizobium diazoefficiens]|nr:hypothetical protein [Bradyrhizobium diazoefficiens]MBR0848800.1 hypothetical protein [Bradyrhizobium diazoefficiens]